MPATTPAVATTTAIAAITSTRGLGGEIAQSGVAAVRRWHSQKLLVWEVGLFGGCRRLAQQAAQR